MSAGKNLLDFASFAGAVATVAGWLPPIAALMSIIWIGFQFYHSAPVERWRNRKKGKRI